MWVNIIFMYLCKTRYLSIIFVFACLIIVFDIIYIIATGRSGVVTYHGQKTRESDKLSRNSSLNVKQGILARDETWSGEVFVENGVVVPPNITLTVEPGTIIKFQEGGDYKSGKKGAILVVRGTIKAIGAPQRQIWFTSNAARPVHGDWSGIEIYNSRDSVFDYVIVEYGGIGIMQDTSSVTVSNSIIRWNSTEGLYAEKSEPIIINNTLYQNGYHEIALEHKNVNTIIKNNKFGPGISGIMVMDSRANIEGNYFDDYLTDIITLTNGIASINNNRFEKPTGQDSTIIQSQTGDNQLSEHGNDYEGAGSIKPVYNYNATVKIPAVNIPSTDSDLRSKYVFDTQDSTRRIVKSFKKGFIWALGYANGYLWQLGGSTIDKIDPDSGEHKTIKFPVGILNRPRGLVYDGEFFWTTDFEQLKVFSFKVINDNVEFYISFDIPEKNEGGLSGIATDGTYIYLPSRHGKYLYKMSKDGRLLEKMPQPYEGPLVWTGQDFWSTGGPRGLVRRDINGNILGSIYPPAVGILDLAWDDKYLWVVTRSNEIWKDEKLFKIEILDDSVGGMLSGGKDAPL